MQTPYAQVPSLSSANTPSEAAVVSTALTCEVSSRNRPQPVRRTPGAGAGPPNRKHRAAEGLNSEAVWRSLPGATHAAVPSPPNAEPS